MGLRRIFTALGLAGVLALNAVYTEQEEPEREKYAILVVGTNEHNSTVNPENLNPIDVNNAWLVQANIYEELLNAGFEKENIRLLYPGTPDFDEKKDRSAIKKAKKEFRQGYDNNTTSKNVQDTIIEIAGESDENDLVVFHIITHGSPRSLQMPDGALERHELKDSLQEISGNILFVSDACYSANFIDGMKLRKAVSYAGCEQNYLCWADREGSGGQVFFEELNNQENDFDENGEVSYEEAHEAAIDIREDYGASMHRFLMADYNWDDGLSPFLYVQNLSFTPYLTTSKYASENDSLQ